LPLSFFQSEYMYLSEFFPRRWIRMYDLDVPIPYEPWAVLNRTYGLDCAYVARMNEHGGVMADLRSQENTRLTRPAAPL